MIKEIVFIGIIILIIGFLLYSKRKLLPIKTIFEWADNILEQSKLNIYPKNLKKLDIPFFYINLDKDIDRRNYIEKQIEKYNIKGTRIPAVYGANYNIKFGELSKSETFINNYDFTHPELGCTLSHIKAIKEAEKSNLDLVLITEDDCCFTFAPFAEKSLREIAKDCPKDWEIIQLSFLHPPPREKQYLKNEIGTYYYGTSAYLINKKGIKRVLDFTGRDVITLGKIVNNMLFPEIGQADRFIYDLTLSYVYTTPVLFPYNVALSSSIHPDHDTRHIKFAESVIESYLKINVNATPTLDEQQLKMGVALLDMRNELNKLKFPYFLMCGTLLGAYRENMFIKGDGDIDLGVFYKDIKNVGIPKQLNNFKKNSEFGRFERGYECSFKHKNGIKIDIFVLYEENDYLWYASYLGMCNKAKEKMCRWKMHKFDIDVIEFMGNTYNIPKNPEIILDDLYGKNWNIPKSFGYFEGLNKGLYKGLIKSDFNRKFEEEKEVKINDLWPRKLENNPKKILWMYWEQNKNSNKPIYLDMCFELINKHCSKVYDVILLNDQKVSQLSRTIHKNFRNIFPLAMRADYIRFTMISEYGGVWLDADILPLSDLRIINELLDKYNFVGFQHDKIGDLSIGIFGGNKHNKICLYLKNIFENDKKYNQWKYQKTELEWAGPTKKLEEFMVLLRKLYLREFVTIYAPETIYPIDWKKSKNYYWTEGELTFDPSNYLAIYLHNNMYSLEQKNMTKEQILNSEMRISKLFKLSYAM